MKINDDEGFNAYVNVTSDDRWIELYAGTYNRNTYFVLANEAMQCVFNENESQIANIIFDKNGISVKSNGSQVLKFTDINHLNVTFTVAELIALKALLQTT